VEDKKSAGIEAWRWDIAQWFRACFGHQAELLLLARRMPWH
jgi:hypothetical protein